MDLSSNLIPIASAPGYAACIESGRVFNLATGRELKPFLKRSSCRYYVHVSIGRVHRLVMSAHLGRVLDRRELVRHKNGNATANAVDNLAVGSAKDNSSDKLRHGTYGSKLRTADAREIKLLSQRMKPAALAAQYDVSVSHIRAIRAGRSWAGLAV